MRNALPVCGKQADKTDVLLLAHHFLLAEIARANKANIATPQTEGDKTSRFFPAGCRSGRNSCHTRCDDIAFGHYVVFPS